MRLELKKGINDCQIIDDTYNNDLGGIEVALAFMDQQNTDLKKTAIISDILQSGMVETELYGKLNNLLSEYNVSKLIGIGEAISKNKNLFNIPITCHSTTDEFILQLPHSHFEKELILVKGARIHQFEKIVHQLAQKIHGTVLEINLNAITRNLNYYQSKLRPNTKIMVMVKAFAYGSGSNEVANLLQHHKVDYLGVAYTDEGVELRKNGIHLPIMVMNPSIESFDKIDEFNLEPEIYNFSILDELLIFAKNKTVGIHLKLDTGMRRLGFESADIGKLITILKEHPNIVIKSIFTHLAGADETIHNEFSMQQFELFEKNVLQIKNALDISPLLHAVNSAGIIRFPDHHLDMVRLGIGLYGVDANKIAQNDLEPISSLKTVISQIKHISKGETIGYGRTGVAINDMKIATIAIGYADGFNRKFGNGVGFVKVNGAKAPTVGNVCMDMTMVDVTNLDINEGDEVEIFGKDISITEMANEIGTIPYEILTSVSNRVKRIFYLD